MLQRLTSNYHVVNMATCEAASTHTALNRLRATALRSGDVVVWMFGELESKSHLRPKTKCI